MQEADGTLIQLVSLILVSIRDVFLVWCAATGWAAPVLLAVGAASMRRFGPEYLIACVILLNLSALNGYYAALYFDLDNTALLFQSLVPFVIFGAGPAIWYSLQAYLDPLFEFRLVNAFHFVPGVLASLVTAVHLYGSVLNLTPLPFQVDVTKGLSLGFGVSLIYGLVSLFRFLKISGQEDSSDQATLYRHRFLWIVGVVFIVLAITAHAVLVQQSMNPIVPLAFSALLLTTIVFIYCRHPELFAVVMESIQSAPHRRTSLPDAIVTHLQSKLGELMEHDKAFIQPDLSMPGLAEQAGVTPHQLSEYLNFYVGSNFARYISGYRIEEVKKRLISSPAKPIIEIALECGFNTKSTFNTAFSDITGMTPSAWRKSHKRSA